MTTQSKSPRVGYIKVDNTKDRRQKVTVSGNLDRVILITLGDSMLTMANCRYAHLAIGVKDLTYWQKIKFLWGMRRWL